MKMVFVLLLLALNNFSSAQQNDSLFGRLQANTNSGIDFFNVDGTEITSQVITTDFSAKTIAKKFRHYGIKEADLTGGDTALGYNNYYVSKSEAVCPGITENTGYYFIEGNGRLTAITFKAINKADTAFQRKFARLVITGGIPKSVYEPAGQDSIFFAGRKIEIGSPCHWMGINNMQCSGYGQMNWSVHKDSADAADNVAYQFTINKAKAHGKVVSEETVDVVLEGAPVKAKKILWDFTGITSVLVHMSGGKSLTIYYVAAPVRGNYVSCVMSYWNFDPLTKSGLPLLLSEVMALKK